MFQVVHSIESPQVDCCNFLKITLKLKTQTTSGNQTNKV
jgi:hypothetical protein